MTHARDPRAGDATAAAPRGEGPLGALASSMGNAAFSGLAGPGSPRAAGASAGAMTGAAQNDDSRPVMRLLAQTVRQRAAGRAAGSPAVLPRQHRGPPRTRRPRAGAPVVVNVDVVLLLSDVPDPRRAAIEDAAMRARVARDIAHAQVVWRPASRRFVFRFTTHEARPGLTSRWLGANHRLDDHVGTGGELLTDEQGAQHGRPFRAGHEQVDMNVGAVSALALTAPIRVFYVPSMVTAAAGTSYPPDHPEARPRHTTGLRGSGAQHDPGEQGMVTIRMDRDDPRALPHELGHMLGLGHAQDDDSQIMAAPSEEDPGRVLGESLSPDYIEEAAFGAALPNAGQDAVPGPAVSGGEPSGARRPR